MVKKRPVLAFWYTGLFLPLMVAVNGSVAMVSLFPFVWCGEGEEFPCESLAFLGELPSPAGAFSGADAVPVDAAGVSVAFEFDHAASQALWRVMASQ